MATLVLNPELFESLTDTARQARKTVDELVNEAVKQYLANHWREQLEQEVAAYEAMHSVLWRTHAGEWVAFHDRTLVDHDVDKANLYRRVHDQFGRVPVLIRRVKADPVEEIWLRTPSTGKIRA